MKVIFDLVRTQNRDFYYNFLSHVCKIFLLLSLIFKRKSDYLSYSFLSGKTSTIIYVFNRCFTGSETP